MRAAAAAAAAVAAAAAAVAAAAAADDKRSEIRRPAAKTLSSSSFHSSASARTLNLFAFEEAFVQFGGKFKSLLKFGLAKTGTRWSSRAGGEKRGFE